MSETRTAGVLIGLMRGCRLNVSVYKEGLLSLLPLRISIWSWPGHDRVTN